jgi:hypothetical protein
LSKGKKLYFSGLIFLEDIIGENPELAFHSIFFFYNIGLKVKIIHLSKKYLAQFLLMMLKIVQELEEDYFA